MAFTDNKITQADLNGKGVTGLPDAPELSTEAMQKKFDEVGKEVIVPKFNLLCEALDANVPPIILPEAPITPQDGDMLVYDAELGAFVFVQKATTLANLKDVDLTGLVNGMYLRYDFPTRSWKATNSSASVPALDDINDVSITNATDGQCLIYNGGTWKNDNEKLDDLKNVYIHLPQNKQLLAYDAANDRWTNVELDGGGHKILNASGTQLAQEEYLQFGGLLKATDENGKTVVTDEAEEISFADWDALTEEQKDEYSAGKKLNILDPPDCDGEVNIELMHLAWQNPNPTQVFPQTEADRTITLDTDDYDFAYVHTNMGDFKTKKGSAFRCNEGACQNSNYVINRFRSITFTSNTVLHVNDAVSQQSNGQARAVDNTLFIPLEIYTYKKTATAKVNVLATNVKATVDYSTSEHKIGKWIDGSDLYEKTVDCGMLPSTAGNKAVAHNISNIDKIISITGVAMRDNGLTITLPNTAVDALSSQIVLYADKTNVNIYVASNQSVNTNSYVTLRYTKTA